MRILGALLVLGVLLLGLGCSTRDPGEELIRFVKTVDFSVPVSVLEMRGVMLEDRWYPATLYFGYGGNGNSDQCREDTDRLNNGAREGKYRCRLID